MQTSDKMVDKLSWIFQGQDFNTTSTMVLTFEQKFRIYSIIQNSEGNLKGKNSKICTG